MTARRTFCHASSYHQLTEQYHTIAHDAQYVLTKDARRKAVCALLLWCGHAGKVTTNSSIQDNGSYHSICRLVGVFFLFKCNQHNNYIDNNSKTRLVDSVTAKSEGSPSDLN
eukprot:scaffold11639_cov172-Amphora_coffeaeformis.AAC.12